ATTPAMSPSNCTEATTWRRQPGRDGATLSSRSIWVKRTVVRRRQNWTPTYPAASAATASSHQRRCGARKWTAIMAGGPCCGWSGGLSGADLGGDRRDSARGSRPDAGMARIAPRWGWGRRSWAAEHLGVDGLGAAARDVADDLAEPVAVGGQLDEVGAGAADG